MSEPRPPYKINEIFTSLQGEGARAGIAHLFVRFSGCNLRCRSGNGAGFDCDTEFESYTEMTRDELLDAIEAVPDLPIIFTGGEPLLQLDDYLLDEFRQRQAKLGNQCQFRRLLCVETNGTREPPVQIDYIACSPKTAEHTLRIRSPHSGRRYDVDEIRYVRNVSQGIPRPSLRAEHYFISPAFEPDGTCKQETIDHCISLVTENPEWRLSLQQHKVWGVR